MARSALDGTLVDCAALPYIPCIDQSTVAVELKMSALRSAAMPASPIPLYYERWMVTR